MDIAPGTKNGEIFFGPFSASLVLFSSMVPKPPIPDPIETPNFDKSVLSRSIDESSIHSLEAIRPYCIKGSVLLTSFLSKKSSTAISTVAANFVSNSEISNDVIGFTPLLPWIILFQDSVTLLPTGASSPRPVITTLLFDVEAYWLGIKNCCLYNRQHF